MRIDVDADRCQAFGLCELSSPALFRVNDDDVAEALVVGDVPAGLTRAASEAATACPVGAVLIRREHAR